MLMEVENAQFGRSITMVLVSKVILLRFHPEGSHVQSQGRPLLRVPSASWPGADQPFKEHASKILSVTPAKYGRAL